jgi:hypothetical protein
MEMTIDWQARVRNEERNKLSRTARNSVHAGVLAISISVLSACSTFDHYAAVPPGGTYKATILGLSNARFFIDRPAVAEQERALVREGKALGIGRGPRRSQRRF